MPDKVVQIRSSPKQNLKDENEDQTITKTLIRIKHKILVMSGKGGVGKSTVAVHLALSLAGKGRKVGLLDVDLHGPSVPRMLGLDASLPGGAKPRAIIHSPNLSVVSIEPLMPDKDRSIIWRGPIKIGVIRQFISGIDWKDLDYLVIDSPPGTGDEPLTVAQTIPDAHVLLVTTPQEVALADVRKSLDFCWQVELPILGLVENMSGMVCPHCHEKIEFFSSGGGQSMAEGYRIPFLGQIPFDPQIVRASESGKPFLKPYEELTNAVLERMEG